MTRPKYRVHVWKSNWKIGGQHWYVGVWEDGGTVDMQAEELPA